MVTYHPDADKQFDDILQLARRAVKKCPGQMIQRHARIALVLEALTQAELVGAGSDVSTLYRVEYVYGLLAYFECVYGVHGSTTEVLAVDARQGNYRLCLPIYSPDALARAWGRST